MSVALVNVCVDPRLDHAAIRTQVAARLSRLGLQAERIYITSDQGGNVGSAATNTVALLAGMQQEIVFAAVLQHDDCLAEHAGARRSLTASVTDLTRALRSQESHAQVYSGTIRTETNAIVWSDEPPQRYEVLDFRMPRMYGAGSDAARNRPMFPDASLRGVSLVPGIPTATQPAGSPARTAVDQDPSWSPHEAPAIEAPRTATSYEAPRIEAPRPARPHETPPPARTTQPNYNPLPELPSSSFDLGGVLRAVLVAIGFAIFFGGQFIGSCDVEGATSPAGAYGEQPREHRLAVIEAPQPLLLPE
jgi:hypothetical protein